ncbi:unnamed protein product [Candidula unifasciata]|uniref:Uncharacterized protein n=1 Tax=Candidula unifasciata TaxID=100452 RepID=A0A8S3ZFB9_9EUPU|nr:unnamed protein product [Candidula unifasciata]
MVAEICSANETIIQGRTLFALMDSRGQHKPVAGSVCTCIAETVKWPTANTITVFMVDVRLNSLASTECSNVSLSVRSGSNDKPIHCQATTDPRTNLPFVTVLNNSNVANLTLEIHRLLPEFVWLGFEANVNEDIQLTCKLQGLLPSPTDGSTLQDLDAIFDSNAPDSRLPALVGGILAGVILVTAVVVIVIVWIVRKRKRSTPNTNTEESLPEYDITYYTTTDEAVRNFQNAPERQGLKDEHDSFPELYVSAEEVIANKRKSNPVQKTVVPAIGYSVTAEDDYVTNFEEGKLSGSHVIGANVKSTNHHNQSINDSYYDRLNRPIKNSIDTNFDSYDQLVPERRGPKIRSATSSMSNQVSKKKRGPENSRIDSNYWVVNDGYDDTSDPALPERYRSDVQGKLQDYFVLQKHPSTRHTNDTYLSKDDLPTQRHEATLHSPLNDDSDDIYNDAESEAGIVFQASSRMNAANKTGVEEDVAAGKNGISRADERQSPVAAPRRKSRVNIVAN